MRFALRNVDDCDRFSCKGIHPVTHIIEEQRFSAPTREIPHDQSIHSP